MSFDKTLKLLHEVEGGMADVGDGKGLTRFGQTPGWLRQFNLPTPTNWDDAATNYLTWMRLTKLASLNDDDVLTKVVVVWAVHSGHLTAIRALQRALKVSADGIIGAHTKGALSRCDRNDIAGRVMVDYTWFLSSLTSPWERGWKNRLYRLMEEFHDAPA